MRKKIEVEHDAQLGSWITHELEDLKAQDIIRLHLTELTDLLDEFIICTATSRRHAQTIAEKLMAACKKDDIDIIGSEGLEQADWILIDLGGHVVHIMLSDVREFYHLEKLWSTH